MLGSTLVCQCEYVCRVCNFFTKPQLHIFAIRYRYFDAPAGAAKLHSSSGRTQTAGAPAGLRPSSAQP